MEILFALSLISSKFLNRFDFCVLWYHFFFKGRCVSSQCVDLQQFIIKTGVDHPIPRFQHQFFGVKSVYRILFSFVFFVWRSKITGNRSCTKDIVWNVCTIKKWKSTFKILFKLYICVQVFTLITLYTICTYNKIWVLRCTFCRSSYNIESK